MNVLAIDIAGPFVEAARRGKGNKLGNEKFFLTGAFRFRPTEDPELEERIPNEEEGWNPDHPYDFDHPKHKVDIRPFRDVEGEGSKTELEGWFNEDEELVVSTVIPMAIPIRAKSEALGALQEMVTRLEKAGLTPKRVHADQDKVFTSKAMVEWCRHNRLWWTVTAGDEPQTNGLAEWAVGKFKSRGRTLLAQAKDTLEQKHWAFAISHLDVKYTQQFLGERIIRRSIADSFVWGQKLMAKIRSWKKTKSGFNPVAEEAVFLGRDLHLSGDGAVIMEWNTKKIRHATTFAEIVESPPIPARDVEVEVT